MLVHDYSSQEFTPNVFNKRNANTVVYNDIPGASLATGVITLPAGKYLVTGQANVIRSNQSGLRLRDVVGGITVAKGLSVWSGNATGTGVGAWSQPTITGIFTLLAPTDLTIQQYVLLSPAAFGDNGYLGVMGGEDFPSCEILIELLA